MYRGELSNTPDNVLLVRDAIGLSRDSVASVSQIFTVD